MTLTERIATVDTFMARKFERLDPHTQHLAAEGIIRLLNACDRVGTAPDACSLREIIEDALDGRQVWKEADCVPQRRVTRARTPVGEGVVGP